MQSLYLCRGGFDSHSEYKNACIAQLVEQIISNDQVVGSKPAVGSKYFNMGFFISKIDNSELNEYIGSNTIYSCADNGAFDGEVSIELEELSNEDESIIAIVDKNGIDRFLNILKSGKLVGRDVQTFISIVEENYKDGFIVKT